MTAIRHKNKSIWLLKLPIWWPSLGSSTGDMGLFIRLKWNETRSSSYRQESRSVCCISNLGFYPVHFHEAVAKQ
jgi:hypothetical protein